MRDSGIGTVRRLYFYTVAFVALVMAANGIVQIGVFLLDAVFGGDVLSPSRIRLATGLSLTIVGLPLWAFHWRLISRHVDALPVEKRSVLRKVYVYLVLGVSAALGLGGAIDVFEFLFRSESFSGYPWSALVVWAGVWAYHWRTEGEEGQTTPDTRSVRRLYLYVVAAVALSASALSIGLIIQTILNEAYLSLTSQTVLAPDNAGLWGETTKAALAVLLVAAPVWVAHWVYFAQGDHQSLLRQLYLYAFATFGSAVTVIVGGGLIIYGALQWALGVPDEEATAHFGLLPEALTSLIIGGGILAYHWMAARAESEGDAPESQAARKAFPYVLAALGLAIVAFGIGALVDTVIEALQSAGSRAIAGEDLWQDRLALAMTLGLLGIPLWSYYWSQIRRRVLLGGVEERTQAARRIFMFGVLGVGMLALLGSLSFLIFVFLRELLDGDLADVVREAQGALNIIVPAAVLLPYHWMVYREDRRVAPDRPEHEVEAPTRKVVTALVGENGAEFLDELQAVLGYAVSPLDWADPDADQPELSPQEYQALAQRIVDAEGAHVLLVPEGGAVRVLSYR